MPNKYEREIEEILRNLEHSEPGKKPGASKRPSRRTRVRRSMPGIRLDFAQWCLLIACISALIAGGWAYTNGSSVVTGSIALLGTACISILAISPFITARRASSSRRRYDKITPIRSNPLSRLRTRWHLLMLKLRYRNKGQERDPERD